MMYFDMHLHLVGGFSVTNPDARLETSTNNLLERFQHHHRLTAEVHLL